MVKETYFNLDKSKQDMIRENVLKMFVSKDFEDVTIRDLAKKCNISVGSFYKYFNSKEDMYLYYMCEVEEKILDEEYKHNKSLFTNNPYIDLNTILSPLEIKFNRTWLNAPTYILSKFYFDGYANKLNSKVLDELDLLYDRGKTSKGLEKDMLKFIYVTYMYNFIMYVRKKNIADSKDFIQLKKLYFDKIVFKGLFTTEYYEEVFGV
ncbi:MAG: TetR/AcrR family transcriptional regulator [Finegoldia magna]|nr:TetR/AcrR family transcriptional regulator [Finegoldia magna]